MSYNPVEDYARHDLRKRFDNAKSFTEWLYAIDKAEELGFTDLVKEMVNDLDEDARRIWDMKEAKIREEFRGDEQLSRLKEETIS